jgi:hypothetical protein
MDSFEGVGQARLPLQGVALAEQVARDEHDTTTKGSIVYGILATERQQRDHQHSAYFTTAEPSAQVSRGKHLSEIFVHASTRFF